MGPYYRGTSQGVGAFFNAFYEHPFLLMAFAAVVIGAGIYRWRRQRARS